jgi:putative transposase
VSGWSSPSTERRYGIQRVCATWCVPRSTFYAQKTAQGARDPRRRGPTPVLSDVALVERIEAVCSETEERWGFRGEGYRKVHRRLQVAGVPAAKRRVLRLMREHDLLATRRSGRVRGPRVHDGTIVTEVPNDMWGTDATMTWTREDGYVWVFLAVDHCNSELIGVHASIKGTRYEALEPIRQAVHDYVAPVEAGVADGIRLRHDHGSQYMSRVFQEELRFLGIKSSPSYVGQPEGNGVSERMVRTLKEQLLWVETFDTVDDLLKALQAFRDDYNDNWLLGRWGHRTPSAVRVECGQPRLAA